MDYLNNNYSHVRERNFCERQEPETQYQLGKMFLEGLGVEKSEQKAAQWFQNAALKGHAQALYMFACMLKDGRGVQPNPVLAKYIFRIANEQWLQETLNACERGKIANHTLRIIDLPHELLVKIISLLNLQTLRNLSLTNYEFYVLTRDPSIMGTRLTEEALKVYCQNFWMNKPGAKNHARRFLTSFDPARIIKLDLSPGVLSSNFCEKALHWIARCHNLNHLDLHSTRITASQLEWLLKVPLNLRTLNIGARLSEIQVQK